MSAVLLSLLPAVAGGVLFTYAWDRAASLPARVLAAVPLAVAGLGLVGYALAAAFGLSAWTGISAALVLLGLGVAAAGSDGAARLRQDLRALPRPPRRALVAGGVYTLALAVSLAAVMDRAIVTTPRGLATGDDHNLGDLPFHLAIVTGFVRGANFPPEHPELSGVRLTYPFGVDMAAALPVAAGATVRQAFVAHDVLLAWAAAFLLWRFARRLTGDGRAALIVPPLVLCSGGLGFPWFLRDLRDRPGGVLELLLRLPRDYTMLDEAGLRWGNALTTLLVPQRSFLLGLPLFLVVATAWWDALGEPDDRRAARTMLGAGLVAGLLPLSHAHGFVVLLSVGALLALAFLRLRPWLSFFGAALLVGVPQVLWMARGSGMSSGRFVGLQAGWDHGETNPVVFWLMNAGPFLVLLLAAFVVLRRDEDRTRLRFVLPFAAWFVVPNLLRLSPWIWDNVKFLFYWYVASAVLVALVLARLSRRGPLGLASAALLFLAATASGALDAWRVASRSREHLLFDREAIAVAERLAAETPPRALVLHFPTYDTPVVLSGRRSLLGYPGHIWSQGLDADGRDDEIRRVYAGDPAAASIIARRGVDYVLVGPQERRELRVADAFLERFPLVLESGPYRLHRVRP